jgi:hypothetical protein
MSAQMLNKSGKGIGDEYCNSVEADWALRPLISTEGTINYNNSGSWETTALVSLSYE